MTATEGNVIHFAPKPASKAELEEAVKRLANLSALEFDQVFKEEADRLGVRSATLDCEVKKARKAAATEEASNFLSNPIPWGEQVDGAELLDKIAAAAHDHVKLPDGGAETISLWVQFSHCHDAFDISPLLPLPARRRSAARLPC
jgi:putative DNA primase/helicase